MKRPSIIGCTQLLALRQRTTFFRPINNFYAELVPVFDTVIQQVTVMRNTEAPATGSERPCTSCWVVYCLRRRRSHKVSHHRHSQKKLVDTNGAGGAFVGGFLTGLVSQKRHTVVQLARTPQV